jgi:APA family basic amino acid/polyamine antiporter
MHPAKASPGDLELPRVLGPVEAFCLVVGSVIGSGVFIVPARVAREIPAMGGIAVAWIVGGVFSLAGALTLAELSAALPQAGGPYVYLKRAYGPIPAFLFSWTDFLVIRSGSMATLAAAFALYCAQLVPAPQGLSSPVWQMILAVGAIAIVTAINIVGTRLGGGVQVLGTVLKVGALLGMMVLPFVLGQASAGHLKPVWPARFDSGFLRGFMIAMVGILWTYDGWVHTSNVAEEVRDPGRNVPRALLGGMAVLIALYLGMTLVYHLVLPMNVITSAATEKGSPQVVAALFCRALLGAPGIVLISAIVMISTSIALNGNALTGPRAYFAAARDGLFPEWLCRVHRRFQTPANAIAAQAAWSMLLTTCGTFLIVVAPPASATAIPAPLVAAWRTLHETALYDVLYSYVIFGGTVIYTMTIAGVFVLRAREPGLHRPYRTWGYPVTPLVYVSAALFLMGNMLVNTMAESLAGLGIILAGVPAYFLFTRLSRGAS